MTTLMDTTAAYAIRIGDTVFVRYREHVTLNGETTELLTGLPVPDASKSQIWHYPVPVNVGTTVFTNGFVEVQSDGSVTVQVYLNGTLQTTGLYTVSTVFMYKAASGS